MTRQFHRPARLDPDAAEQIEGNVDTAESSELAHRSAQALIGGFEQEPLDDAEANSAQAVGLEAVGRRAVVEVVACHGVDEVAQLWADSPATTLPGTLWRLFLVREWMRRDPQLIESRYATTIDLGQADAATLARFESALAQAHRAPSPTEIRRAIDTILAGRIEGSVTEIAGIIRAVAAFLHALALGSSPVWIEDDADELADRVTRRDSALEATAAELREAAQRAAAGLLD